MIDPVPLTSQPNGLLSCWHCRRRRVKCEGGSPPCRKCLKAGLDCSGYHKPLRWVKGVATRGPMRNFLYGETRQQQQQPPTDTENDAMVVRPGPHHHSPPSMAPSSETGRNQPNASDQSSIHRLVTTMLTEPMFQGLGMASRFFVHYFSRRICPIFVLRDRADNQYRKIIPLIGSSPAVANAIVAVAACHFAHSLMESPLGIRSGTKCTLNGTEPNLPISKASLISYYLRCKAKCFEHLSAALQDQTQAQHESILVTVMLLVILDLVEGGAGSWRIHLQGATRLLQAGADCRDSHAGASNSFLHEVIIFQAFGSSLARSSDLQSILYFPPSQTDVASLVTSIGCPEDIILAVRIAASQRRSETMALPLVINVTHLEGALALIRGCDIYAWAVRMVTDDLTLSFQDLVNLGTIWKLSAEIYACSVLLSLTRNFDIIIPPADRLINEFAFLEREDDELLKCLVWPTFIAGVASASGRSRAWALQTLRRLFHIALCANARNAALVLVNLWERQDQRAACSIPSEWDWISELSQLQGSWLFV